MAGIGADLKTWVTASTSVNAVISGRMHQDSAPQDTTRPFVWYQRTGEEELLTIDQVGGLRNATFDVECVATVKADTESLVDKVKTRLHGKRGTFGASTVQGSFVSDHSGDYVPKSAGLDSGLFIESFNVLIWFTT